MYSNVPDVVSVWDFAYEVDDMDVFFTKASLFKICTDLAKTMFTAKVNKELMLSV